MKTKKMLAMFLAICCIGGTMSACGGREDDTTNKIQIVYRKAGLGLAWVENMIAAFEKKYPEYEVEFDYASEPSYVTTTFGLGVEYDPNDLYMFPQKYVAGDILAKCGEPLDDVLETTVQGESKTIYKKFWDGVLEPMRHKNGKLYGIPYGGGPVSIAYDKNIINGTDFKLPNTTDELEELTILLKEAGHTPSIHFEGGGYWTQVIINWFVQYDGLDYWQNRYLALTDEEGNTPYKGMLTETDDGRYEALKVLEKILTPDMVYNGCNSFSFTASQTHFLNGEAVMMANGSWLMNEMGQSKDKQHYGLMKTPVISSLADRLVTVDSDVELSALVTAIDACAKVTDVTLSGEGYEVSEADRNRVWEARNSAFSTLSDDTFIIPNYAKAKEGAKKFIEFYCSDEGMTIYTKATGMTTALNYDKGEIDTTGWTEWQIDQLNLTKSLTPICERYPNSSEVFSIAHAAMFWQYNWANNFSTNYSADRKSAASVWSAVKSGHNSDWEKYLKNANLD